MYPSKNLRCRPHWIFFTFALPVRHKLLHQVQANGVTLLTLFLCEANNKPVAYFSRHKLRLSAAHTTRIWITRIVGWDFVFHVACRLQIPVYDESYAIVRPW